MQTAVCDREIQIRQRACGCQLSLSRNVRPSGLWSCNPSDDGSGTVRAESSTGDFGRTCHKLVGSHQFQKLMSILGPLLAAITDSVTRASDPRKCGVHFSIGVHTLNHTTSAWDLANGAVQFSPEFKLKRLSHTTVCVLSSCTGAYALMTHTSPARRPSPHCNRTPRIRPSIQ